MNTHVIVVSALHPPLRGGLADHTAHLARHLARRHVVHVLTSTGTQPIPGSNALLHPDISQWDDRSRLEDALARLPGSASVVWQYVPHMYGRGGINRALPKVVRSLSDAGRRQCVLAHEIHAEWSWRPDQSWQSFNHRLQWRTLTQTNATLLISTEAWIPRLEAGNPGLGPRLRLLPSPSNIEVQPVPPDHAAAWRARHHLEPTTRIVGYFGNFSHHPWKGLILDAWNRARQALPGTALAIIGDTPHPAIPDTAHARCLALGHLPDAEVSLALQAMDVILLPYIDGVSERRGSFMAAIAHGRPVVTQWGHNTGPTLRNGGIAALADPGDRDAFATQALRLLQDRALADALGAKARDAYRAHYSWETVCDRLAPLLG